MDTSFQHDEDTLPGFCPHCGGGLRPPQPYEDGPFHYDPETNTFSVGGERLEAMPKVHLILGTIMMAKGRRLDVGFIADKTGFHPKKNTPDDRDHAERSIYVHMTTGRKAVLRTGNTFPIETIPGWHAGYRWNRNAQVHRGTTKHRLEEP